MALARGEQGLLIFFLVTALYMFVESFEFQETAAFFPRLTSTLVIVGSVLLLLREYLPEPLGTFLADDGDGEQENRRSRGPVDGAEDEEAPAEPSAAETEEKDDVQQTTIFGRDVPIAGVNRGVLTVLVAVYIALSYLIGMLWATPVFVLGYAAYARLPVYLTVALPIIGFAIAYVFMGFVYLPIDSGVLHDWGWI